MLENVGVRFGVGPATSDSFSSQPAAADTETAITTIALRKIMTSLLRYGVAAAPALTTSVPFMSPWPSPQNTEQRMGNLPASLAVNSITTGSPPRGISFETLNFLISKPCSPSPDLHQDTQTLALDRLDLRRLERDTAAQPLRSSGAPAVCGGALVDATAGGRRKPATQRATATIRFAGIRERDRYRLRDTARMMPAKTATKPSKIRRNTPRRRMYELPDW